MAKRAKLEANDFSKLIDRHEITVSKRPLIETIKEYVYAEVMHKPDKYTKFPMEVLLLTSHAGLDEEARKTLKHEMEKEMTCSRGKPTVKVSDNLIRLELSYYQQY